MENIKTIMSQLNRQFLGGSKIPHGMSNPVLRKQDDKYVIAVFFYTYKKEHLDAKQLPRPKYWTVADVETGKLLKENSCQDVDFSKQSFEELYSTEKLVSINPTPEYFSELFKLFNEVRDSLINTDKFESEKYSEYMDKMLAIVPPSYRIFYNELSGEVSA